MKKLLYIAGLTLMVAPGAGAVTVLSTDSGPSEGAIQQGVSQGIVETVAKNAADWVANGMDSLGNWALQTLFDVYDKYIGTFLIKIPDLASPITYTAMSKQPGMAGEASLAVAEVLNLLKITSGFGLYLLLVFFLVDVGQRSSGFWGRPVEPSMVLVFVGAFTAIFAWPFIHSLLTNGVTALGYYLYNQNTLKTSGVLEGFADINLGGPSGLSAVQVNQIDFRGNFIKTQGIIWDFFFLVSLSLVILGFYNCYSAVAAGDSKSGNYKFIQAVSGIILILSVPTLVHVLLARGADTVGSTPAISGETLVPYSVQGLMGNNGVQYPPQQASSGPNLATAGNQPQDESRIAKFGGGLLKCGAALWGLIVCFSVIFAKFFQVLNLWVLFLLGPAFIGCLGHPATAPIFWGALRYFVKQLLYSVFWAITLVGLYLIPNIDWGIETIGVNSLLTACAVIAGLQMIANVQEFASLFTTFQGGNLRGDGIKDFARDNLAAMGAMNAARLKTAGGIKAATGETGQAVGTAAGAAVGSIIPFVGTTAGAVAGGRFVKGLNMIGNVGGIGGRDRGGEGTDNPVSGLVRKFAGDSISKGMDKEFTRSKGDFSKEEMEKRRLIGSYAKRLQRGGPPPTVRGMGKERRGGDGNPT